jgi:aspartokinase-like uncharacterized kinase
VGIFLTVDVCGVVVGAASEVAGATAVVVVADGGTEEVAAVVAGGGFAVVVVVLGVELQLTSTMTSIRRIANMNKPDFFTFSSFLLLRGSLMLIYYVDHYV